MCGKASAEICRARDEGRQQLPRIRPLYDHRLLLGGRGQPDLRSGIGLEVVLHHVRLDARTAAGGGGDVEAVLGEPADDAVVADEAVLAEREAVAAAADASLARRLVYIRSHEGDGIGADDL